MSTEKSGPSAGEDDILIVDGHKIKCVAAAKTLEETRQLIREAIEFHIEGMRMHGDAVPEPTPYVEQIEVSA